MRFLSTVLFGAALMAIASIASAQYTAPPPQPGEYTLPAAATPFISGSSIYKLGGFSSLFYAGGNEFWTITDRGPNVDSGNAKVFPTPDFQPLIFRLRLLPNGTITIVETIPLKRPDGSPVSGLPNPGFYSTGEVARDTNFALLGTDDWGFDTEGLVRVADGSFWFCEEYAPGIAHVAPDGTVIERVRPQPGGGGLPDIIRKHVPNRGCEGIAITPNGRIYTIVQSGMANSYANTASANKTASEQTEMLRLVEYDPATGGARMFAYMIDAYPSGGSNIRRRDIKIGDMTALNNNELLLVEHAQRGAENLKRVYKISLAGATPITAEVFQPTAGTFKALEELTRAQITTVAGITPVTKTLLLDLLNPGPGNPAWPVSLDKPEGLSLIDPSTLVVGNDNDFGVISENADGKITLTGSQSKMLVYRLSTPLDYQMGARGEFLHDGMDVAGIPSIFGEQTSCVGEGTLSLPITVTNPSGRDLAITGAEFYQLDSTITGTEYRFRRSASGALIPSADYILTATPGVAPIGANPSLLPILVPHNSTRTIYVTFVASRPGKRPARAIIRTNAQNFSGADTSGVVTSGLLRFDLFGSGSGGHLSESIADGLPKSITFPRTLPGDSSDVKVYLSNSGSCQLRIPLRSIRIFSGDVEDFHILSMPGGTGADPLLRELVMEPGMRDSITVRFTPSRPGSRRATMWLQSNDSTMGSPGYASLGVYSIDLFGVGKSDLHGEDIDLGEALIGGDADEYAYGAAHLENTSNERFEITRIAIGGADAAEFLPDGWPSLPYTLLPGGRLDLGLAFAPAIGGSAGPREGELLLFLKNGDSVTMGVRGMAGTRILTVSPGSILFPVLSRGKESRRTITITNDGTMPMRIDVPVIGGGSAGDFSIGTLPRLELKPGQREFIEITYRPVMPGESNATLTVLSNALLPEGLAVVQLNGIASKTHGVDDPSGASTWIGPGRSGGERAADLSISSVLDEAVSGGVHLHRSAPNPGRDRVEIGYELAAGGPVELDLYDGNGRRVHVLDAGVRESGIHRVMVDVSGLPSGTYHYQLLANGQRLVQTLTVVK